MNRRPKTKVKHDSNHGIVTEFLKIRNGNFWGLPLDSMDISKRGGRRVDWILWLGPLAIAIEVKTESALMEKDSGMTPGEIDFFNTNPGCKGLASTVQDLEEICRNYFEVAEGLGKLLEVGRNEF